MTRGDEVAYRCLAGRACRAKVFAVNADGTVDVEVDAGSADPVHLTRIEVARGKPGCCWRDE